MMLLTPESFETQCRCGREHHIAVKRIAIAPGALQNFDEHMAAAALNGKRAAIYDENTFAAVGASRPRAEQEIVLSPQHLHATETAVDQVLGQLSAPAVLIAVGAGTIHDITRYCAAKLGIPFVACPTAASVDGFASTVAAMTWNGFKVTFPAVAPSLIVADLDIIRHAPLHLASSGIGDMLGKYISLVDWRIGKILTDEYYCEYISSLTTQAVDSVRASCAAIPSGDEQAYEQLTYGLILSGLAMQLCGNSRPASGAEHHMSHLWELAIINPDIPALHGEKVAVGTLIAAGIYHRLAVLEDISGMVQPFTPIDADMVHRHFGALADDVLRENQNDCLAAVSGNLMAEKWQEIRRCIGGIPTAQEICAVMRKAGVKTTLEELSLPQSLLADTVRLSPYVRNRLTLMRTARLFRQPDLFAAIK